MFGKGFVYQGNRLSPSQFLMLVVLREGPMYGYEILKALREEFEGLWRPETGALYPALKRLMEHGLVQVDARDDKEYYQLTEPAQAWLRETLRDIGPELIFASKYMEVLAQCGGGGKGRGRRGRPPSLGAFAPGAGRDRSRGSTGAVAPGP